MIAVQVAGSLTDMLRLNARKTLRLQQSSAEHDPSLPVVIHGTDRRSRPLMLPGQMVRLGGIVYSASH